MDNRNRDRGTIKWTSLMLPEHVEMVKQVWKEDERVDKPILDEQQMEEISFALQRAIHDDLTVEIKYYNGFNFSYTVVKVYSIDTVSQGVRCINMTDKLNVTIQIQDISDVKIV